MNVPRDRPHLHHGARFERIADDLAQRIRRGEYAEGSTLPTSSLLAEQYEVARGTIRHALERLDEQYGLVAHRGARWVVNAPARVHSLSVLRSFGQWALATGSRPSGRTLSLEHGRATRVEATELGIRYRDPVLRAIRVRALDERPVLVERTTYPHSVAEIIAGLPEDTPSVMRVLERDHGVVLAHGEHRVSATVADAADADILGVRRGVPLLRVRRTGRSADGSAFEYSEDHYVADAIELSIVNSNAGGA